MDEATATADPSVEVTYTLTDWTAEDPATAQAPDEQAADILDGKTATLHATAGDPDAMAAVEGLSVAVTSLGDTTVALDVDATLLVVDGLVVEATTTVEAPPPGTGNHFQASKSPGVTTIWHPSPGVGGMRVEPNAEDTALGTWDASQDVPDPAAPLTKRISNADALAAQRAALDVAPIQP